MSKTLKIAHYGCGKMGRMCIEYAINKGAEIVGAFDLNPNIVGKDIGEVIGKEPIGVIVSHVDDAEKILSEIKPDICTITTQTLIKDVKDVLMMCAKNGINAVTISEESLYSWNSSPKTTKEIDEIAKQNNCTICGTGYQDVCYGNLLAVTAGAVHKIDKIKLLSTYNLDDYGIYTAEFAGAGFSLEKFDKEITSSDRITKEERAAMIENETYFPTYMWNVNGWIAEKMGLTIVSQEQVKNPTFYYKDIFSTTLNKTIKAGNPTGMSAIVTTHTEEDIVIESEIQGRVYAEGEDNIMKIEVIGEANTSVEMTETDNAKITCAVLVNRIPDVINAEPGFKFSANMPSCIYRTNPLSEYIK